MCYIKDESLTWPESISGRAVSGGIWVIFLRTIEKLLNIIRLIILARILLPSDFGLLGIALLTLDALLNFSESGFMQALIQKEGSIDSYLDSAWSFLVIRGLLLFTLLYIFAPYLAGLFKIPEAVQVIRAIGLSVIFQGFSNIAVVRFKKDLTFNKYFAYQLSGTIADFAIALIFTFIFKNVWALVFGVLARDFTRLISSYLIHSYRPRFNLSARKLKELFGFGKWVLSSSILGFLISHSDDIIVARILGAISLGFYQMAYKISNIPTSEITHIISHITLPAYSKLQKDVKRLKEAYLRVLRVTAIMAFPVAGFIIIFAKDFTAICLGQKWMPMVIPMQILTLSGMIRSIAATSGTVFLATGKPRIDTLWQVVRLAVLLIAAIPFILIWGTIGAAYAVLLSIFVSNIGFCFQCMKIIECPAVLFLKITGFILAAATGSMVLALFVRNITAPGTLSIVSSFFTALFVYSSIIFLFGRHFGFTVKNILGSTFPGFAHIFTTFKK
ncbi:MAG: lipopolysaccharide biosynthesis protein [Candidatus Omnitrophota bacterium]